MLSQIGEKLNTPTDYMNKLRLKRAKACRTQKHPFPKVASPKLPSDLIFEQIPILMRANQGDHQPLFTAKALGNHHSCREHHEWLGVNITWQLIDSLSLWPSLCFQSWSRPLFDCSRVLEYAKIQTVFQSKVLGSFNSSDDSDGNKIFAMKMKSHFFKLKWVYSSNTWTLNPFAPRDFAEKLVLKLVEWFSGHCRAIKS